MTYKDWTREQLVSTGKRLVELIGLAKKEMMKNPSYQVEFLNAIYRAEVTLTELRKEWKQRTNNS